MSRKPPQHITFGDLISIDGYDGHLYFVECWTIEHNCTPDGNWTEIWYDVTNASTGEYQMAEAHDITRICGADQADDYLKHNASAPEEPKKVGDLSIPWSEIKREVPKMKSNEQRKPSARELSGIEAERRKQARKEKAERIDALLDEYNDAKALVEMFGDEKYRAKVEYLTVKLAEITAE